MTTEGSWGELARLIALENKKSDALKGELFAIELIARTALEMKRLPENEHVSLESLAEPAYRFLVKCRKTIKKFQFENVTYCEGIRQITGYRRIREEQKVIFARFYVESQSNPKYSNRWTSDEIQEISEAEQELLNWQNSDSMPVKVCLEQAPKFKQWQRERLAKLAEIKASYRKKNQKSS